MVILRYLIDRCDILDHIFGSAGSVVFGCFRVDPILKCKNLGFLHHILSNEGYRYVPRVCSEIETSQKHGGISSGMYRSLGLT